MPRHGREAQAKKEPAKEKVPTPEQLESFLRIIDRDAAREGLVRTPIKLGEDSDGNAFGIIVWGKL
jgi:GTP cyclohydrolase I